MSRALCSCASSLSSGGLPDWDAASLSSRATGQKFLTALFVAFNRDRLFYIPLPIIAECFDAHLRTACTLRLCKTRIHGTLLAACLAAECAYEPHLVIQRAHSLTHALSLTALAAAAQKNLHGRGPHCSWRRSVGLSLSLSSLPLACPQLVLLQKLQGVFCSSEFAKTPMSIRRLAIGSVVPWEVHTASRRSATHDNEYSVTAAADKKKPVKLQSCSTREFERAHGERVGVERAAAMLRWLGHE